MCTVCTHSTGAGHSVVDGSGGAPQALCTGCVVCDDIARTSVLAPLHLVAPRSGQSRPGPRAGVAIQHVEATAFRRSHILALRAVELAEKAEPAGPTPFADGPGQASDQSRGPVRRWVPVAAVRTGFDRLRETDHVWNGTGGVMPYDDIKNGVHDTVGVLLALGLVERARAMASPTRVGNTGDGTAALSRICLTEDGRDLLRQIDW